jgi:hypothetical protein
LGLQLGLPLKNAKSAGISRASGGRGGIRTHGGLAPTAVFKTAALNHSATPPEAEKTLRLYALSKTAAPDPSTQTVRFIRRKASFRPKHPHDQWDRAVSIWKSSMG